MRPSPQLLRLLSLWIWLNPLIVLAQAGSPFDSAAKIRADIRPSDVVRWSVVSATLSADALQLEVGLRLETLDNFSVYSNRLEFYGPPGFGVKQIQAPAIKTIIDPMEGKEVDVYATGEFIVSFAGLKPLTTSSTEMIVEYTSCTEVICLFPYKERLRFDVVVDGIGLGAAESSYDGTSPTSVTDTPGIHQAPKTEPPSTAWYKKLEQTVLGVFTGGDTPFWQIMILVFVGGLLSNLTPCVYPMIPITIRILGNTGHSLLYSYLYGTGIVVTYTGLGVFAGLTGSMFGKFMQSPTVNFGFGALMAILALGMLGFGNLSALQSIGSRIGAGKISARNTFLMGMGAGLVAAPCTGPIMIALLGYAAKTGSFALSVTIFLVYSSGFAIPYVFLGAGAAKIGQRRFSHRVQVFVKLLFAAVMFALAFYYLRIPFYQQLKALDGIWSELALVLVIVGLIASMPILIVRKLGSNKAAAIIPTVILGLGLFATYKASSTGTSEINWYKSETEAFAAARSSGRPVFVDGWAEWCLACIEMDQSTFIDEDVIKELNDHWIALKLDLTESTDENDQLIEKYGFIGLPSFALLQNPNDAETMKVLAGKQDAQPLLEALHEYRQEMGR
jgi:thioredoxin:protein disulfide reductase